MGCICLLGACGLPTGALPQQPPAAPATAEQQERLKERDRYRAEMRKQAEAGNLAEAVAAAEKVLAIERAVLGNEHGEVVVSLQALAGLYERREDFAAARKARQEVLALETKRHGAADWRVTDARLALEEVEGGARLDADGRRLVQEAEARHNQVLQLHRQYRFREAAALAEEEVGLRRRAQGESHRAYAASLNNLALLYGAMGDLARALPLFEQVRELDRRLLTENHPHYADSLTNLANLNLILGDYARALPLYEQARDLRKRLLTEDHPAYAASLNNLASLYEKMGDYSRALPLYEQARDRFRRLQTENHPDYAGSLGSLANLYQEMGDYAKALPLYEQACDLYRRLLEKDPAYANTLNNLAVLYRNMGEYGKALTLYEQARDLQKRFLGENHLNYATSLSNLAGLYQTMGDYAKALPLHEQARDVRRRLLTENHRVYAASLNNVASVYLKMRDYARALPLYEQARDLQKHLLPENHPERALILANLGLLHQAMGDHARALPLYEQALTVRLAVLDSTFTALSSRQRLDLLAQLQRDLHAYLTVAVQQPPETGAVYAHVLAWKGAVAARHAEERLAQDQPALRPVAQRLRQTRLGLAQLVRTPPSRPQQQAAWLQRFRDLEAEKEQLEVRLAQESAVFRRARELRAAGAAQVRQALPERTALVDYLVYTHVTPLPERKEKGVTDSRLLAFVVARGREPALIALGAAAPVERAVEDWRRAVARLEPPPEAVAAELVRRVWEPLRPHLGDATTVLVAPDGPLTGLPFAALPGRQPGSFLLEEITLGYVTSGRQSLELAGAVEPPAGPALLALGDPAYGTGGRWAALLGTRLEVQRLAGAFRRAFPGAPAPTVLLQADAEAGRLKRALTPEAGAPGYRHLHLATHGFFEPPLPGEDRGRPADGPVDFEGERRELTFGRNPLLLSGLVLAGANGPGGQGTLTAEEVASLDLRGCELAVLSACETGLGKVAGGEGVLGLQRAFQAAGARGLLVSLWSVNDGATAVLMDEFYANLWQKKLPRLEALRQAQRTLLRDPGRVARRLAEMRQELAQAGQPADGVRGPRPRAVPDSKAGGSAPRSPVAWWAGFVLSGDPR
jgi:CHAT domain-containing protein/tetratricopeptide (TPR) repeat protein